MSSDLVPRSAAPYADGSENTYQNVQMKLGKLGKAMDDIGAELAVLHRSMRKNASSASDMAQDIANAGLDPKFVALTMHVEAALAGAASEVRSLCDSAQETATLAHQARTTHQKLYGALDDIRSNRRERTPKPGFFNR